MSAPSATKKPMTIAVPSDAAVSSRARSAPLQYGSEESASQKSPVSKPTSVLLDRAGRDLVLHRDLGERSVRLELLDAHSDLLADRPDVALAEVDAERVARGECVADGDLPRMLLRLVRVRRVLRQDGVGAAEQHLRDGVVVAGIALKREADLLLQRLQVLLVLRPRLNGDDVTLERARALNALRISCRHDQHAVRAHVRHDARLLLPIGRDEDAADDRIALLRVE